MKNELEDKSISNIFDPASLEIIKTLNIEDLKEITYIYSTIMKNSSNLVELKSIGNFLNNKDDAEHF